MPIHFNPLNNHYYEFIVNPLQWSAARTAAAQSTFNGLQGYLATVTSASENDFISAILADERAWIGASDAAESGVWRWVTGPEGQEEGGQGRHFFQQTAFGVLDGGGHAVGAHYNNFQEVPWAEPNDLGGESFAHVNPDDTWNDAGDAVPYGYVVEYSSVPLVGTNADDTLIGGVAADRIYGLNGDDLARGSGGGDRLAGGNGDDELIGGSGSDSLYGADGDDRLVGGSGDDRLSGGDGDDVLAGGSGNDRLSGGNGSDLLNGGSGGDRLGGGSSGDDLRGGTGNDTLNGGGGADTLTGGDEADWFVFTSAIEIGGGDTGLAQDSVSDLVQGEDKLDFAQLDANATDGPDNDVFSFIGTAAFSAPGELRYQQDAATNRTFVEGNVDGDLAADFQLSLSGLHALDIADLAP